MISVEKEAKTEELAIEECLAELGVTMEQVEVEILRKPSLFNRSALVKVTKKETVEDKAKEFLDGLMSRMGLECNTSVVTTADGQSYINVSGKDNGVAIGYRGEILDAMQYITLLAVNNGSDDFSKITLDAENYREKRAVTLTDLAHKLADKAVRTGRAVDLEPMNPFERRVVHTALQDNPEVSTESSGLEPNRHITIIPKNMTYHGNSRAKSYGTSNDFRQKGAGRSKSYGGDKKKY